MIGQTISHYRIVSMLGEGGMGTVYAAEDTRLGRRVAIKFLNASSSDHHYRARFLREARAISSLSHPHIATVYEYGETEDQKPYLVMELVEGETLGELLDASALTLSRAVEIIEHVADALAEAHASGIVHRDIKPSNVIITTRGQVKVLDFGLAKRITEEEYHDTDANAQTLLATHTRDGIVVGTPLYLSPEQATGAEVDGRSDIFALGALLYECISGKPAFSGGSVIEIGAQIIHINPPPPSEINRQIPPELDRITLKALAKNPDDRYQKAEEMQRDLVAAYSVLNTNGNKIQRITPPHGKSYRKSALTTLSVTLRKPRISLFTLAATVFAVALVIATLVWLVRPKPYAAPPDAQTFYDRGTNFLREGAYHQASKTLEEAINIDPKFALAHARLAEAWVELDYTDKAKDEMLRVNQLVPNRSALTKLDGFYLDAINAMVTNEYGNAAGFYEKIAKATPNKPDVYVDLGRAYEKNEQVDLAIDSYLKATNQDGQYPLAYLRAGVMYIRKRDVQSALSSLDKAGNLYNTLGNLEGRTEVLYQRASVYTTMGKLQEAQTTLQQALELVTSTNNAIQKFRVILQLSRVANDQGDLDKARGYADDALRIAELEGLSNQFIIALLDLANTYNVWTEYEESEEFSRRALELSQRNRALRLEAQAKLTLGVTMMQTLRAEDGFPLILQALDFYQRTKNPRQISFCLTYVGREHRRKGEHDQAVKAFNEKLQIAERGGDPKEVAFAKADIAMAFAKQERYNEALTRFDESNEINKAYGFIISNAYSLMNRASVLSQLGRAEEARVSLEEAADLANRSKGGLKAVLAEIEMIRAQIALTSRNFADARKFSSQSIELAGTAYPDVAIVAKITLGIAQSLSGATAEGKHTCEEAMQMANKSREEGLISDAMLALAGALYHHGDFDEALNYSLTVQERLARSGEQESEWRAWLLAAQSSIRKGDREKGRERLARTNDSLSRLQAHWGTDAFNRYLSRLDIQFSHKQLSDALSAVL